MRVFYFIQSAKNKKQPRRDTCPAGILISFDDGRLRLRGNGLFPFRLLGFFFKQSRKALESRDEA